MARPSPSLASCYAKAVLRPGSVASILLLAGCTPRGPTGVTEPPSAVASSPPAPPFRPAPRYASTFEAHYEGCRGPFEEARGSVVLTIDAAREAALELTIHPRELDVEIEGPDGQPLPPAGPIECRFEGKGSVAQGQYVVTLDARHTEEGPRCGEPSSFELRCRPQRLELPDAQGGVEPTELLRCTLSEPRPAVLWVLGPGDELMLAEGPLHSTLQRATMGIDRQELVRSGPPSGSPSPE